MTIPAAFVASNTDPPPTPTKASACRRLNCIAISSHISIVGLGSTAS